MTSRRWRTLVVDDEPPARALLGDMVRSSDGLELVGVAADGVAAVEAIRNLEPDLVLLDIAMPGLDGFGVIEQVSLESMPLTVFVTAYNEFAVQAFRAHAFDYLLKPIDRQQFAETVSRVTERLSRDRRSGDEAARLQEMLASIHAQRAADAHLTLWSDGRAAVIRTSTIDRVDADGNYLRVVAKGTTYVIRETMAAFENRLDAEEFVRLNRSTIVSMNFIREVQTYFHGDFAIVLADGTSVITGRTYRERLRRRFRGA